MQRPRAHITRQGAADRISGATPMAVSQSQPRPSPVPASASPPTASTYRLATQDRTTSGGNDAVEQHDAIIGVGGASGTGVEGSGAGFVISKLSIIFVLL